MNGNALLRPMVAALSLVLRGPALLALAVLIATAAIARSIQTQAYLDAAPENFVWISLLGSFGPALVNATLIYFLARRLLASETGNSPPLLLRAVGLYVMAFLLTNFISFLGSTAIITGNPSPFMMSYGTSLVGSLGAIVTFPIIVRTFATAAGIEEPTLGPTWAFVFDEGRYGYLWYALCAIFFTALMVFTFANLLPGSNEANALPGNLLQSTITATGSLLRFMLAIVVAQIAAPSGRREAEVFA